MNSAFFMRAMAIAVSTVWLTNACLAQQEKPTHAQILQVWEKRQIKADTIRFELTGEQTIPKGSLSLKAKLAGFGDQVKNKEPMPPKDYLTKGTSRLSLEGTKLSYTLEMEEWIASLNAIRNYSLVTTFDGQRAKTLRTPESPEHNYPRGRIKTARQSGVVQPLQLAIAPLIWGFRGAHPLFNNLNEFEVTGNVITISNRPCLELVQRSRGADRREVFYLDQAHDYVVVRWVVLEGDQPTWQIDITYAADPVVSWVPNSWEYVLRDRTSSSILESGRRTVVTYKIGVSFDSAEFDINFPPNTIVTEETPNGSIEYVIKDNMQKGQAIPTRANPSYEDLVKSAPEKSPSSKSRLRYILAGLSLIFIASLVIIVRLQRRRTKVVAPPQHP